MFKTLSKSLFAVAAVVGVSQVHDARAADHWTINIPRRSLSSPVQRLNREGVQAINKHEYEKAEGFFYKAYLYDPSDPFTLNNLGYVSELEGRMDRARKFYDLAAEQESDANIDLSSARQLQGKPMKTALANLSDLPMRVNHINIDAMWLLSEGRNDEALTLLEQAGKLDPGNPFTLNNLGVAEEAVGDYPAAIRNYRAAAAAHSSETIVVAGDRAWRGKPVSQMAETSANRLQERMTAQGVAADRAAMLAYHGVFALNQNDWAAAKEDFLRAYDLDPQSAFSLNNRGYVAEREGDLESAQFFYEKARRAADAGVSVGLATQLNAQGKPLSAVATDSNDKVDGALDVYSRQRKREQAPVELIPRDAAPGTQQSPKEH